MEEVHGEFFWREDHEQARAETREAAYPDGYEHGFSRCESPPSRSG